VVKPIIFMDFPYISLEGYPSIIGGGFSRCGFRAVTVFTDVVESRCTRRM
jgi:hypothetical protein